MRWLKRSLDFVFFSHMTSVLRLGNQRSLQAEDLPELPKFLDPEAMVFDESKITWNSGRQLIKSLLSVSRVYWLKGFAFYAGFAAMNLIGPVFVNRFIKQLSLGLTTSEDLLWAAVYGVSVGAAGIFGGISIQHYFYRNLSWQQMMVNIINRRVFTHALALRKEVREATPVGDIVNHLSSDTDSVAEAGGAIADMIYNAIMIVGAIGLLFYYLGNTAWLAVILLGVLAPITQRVSRDFTKFDEDLMKWRDQRVTLMSQILSAIRLVKYFGWEKSVSDEVGVVRERELSSRKRIARAELITTLLYVAVGTFVLFAVLAVHAYRGGAFDPALVFTCVSLFGLLEDPFAQFSRVLSIFIAAKVGGDRITGFLKLATISPSVTTASDKPVGIRYGDLTVSPGRSLAVIGGVGSGKSTFLQALIGEVNGPFAGLSFIDENGEAVSTCRLSLVSQEAYILNGSLRENLTFGRNDVSDHELNEALRVSCLTDDVLRMAGGLATEIGEKGINLSGGQRQRLSLARAVLHRPQLVVLDDPLSAVDAATEAFLVRELLFGEWRSKSVIMVTHRLSHLEEFDHIAFLKNGELKAFGSFSDLREKSLEFRSYLDEYARSQVKHDASTRIDEAASAETSEASRVTEDEDRHVGAVGGGMYWQYVKSLGGEDKFWRPVVLLSLFGAAVSLSALPLLQKSWLAMVSNAQSGNAQSLAMADGTIAGIFRTWAQAPASAIGIYGIIALIVMTGTLLADLFWLRQGLASGRLIHEKMLRAVLGSRIRFFDSTPVGRALQRFSRDLEAIDIHLRWTFEHSLKCFMQVAVTLVLIVSVLPIVLIMIVPIFFVYYRMQKIYRTSAREVKRLDSIARSPRYAHFKETLQGLVVIRAYKKTDWFLAEFYRRLRSSQRMFHGHYMINRWFSSRIPVVGGLVSIATAIGIIWAVRAQQITPGVAGLLTTYSLSFWGVLNWGIRIWAEVEARMTSMERVTHFVELPQEPQTTVSPLGTAYASLSESWPTRGAVTFQNVKARYAEHMPLILKGLSFHVDGGARVGIVGRTGSGKSTLFQALYRFVDVESGAILIDGVDIAAVPLARLRRALAIIPQDPTLFMGTLRTNLDRYDEHSDEALWSVLDRTSLGDFVRELPNGLSTELVENGVNLSQGQRQLLCLGRALLMNAKVILLDEATASVDVKTDAVVQRVLRESCAGVTMLIIAHRLGTTRDCDLVIEIAGGELVGELDLRDPNQTSLATTTLATTNLS